MSARIERAQAHERRRAGETALSDFAEYVEKKQQARVRADSTASVEDHDELDILESLGLSDEAHDVKLKEILLDDSEESKEKLKELILVRIKEGRGETMFDIGVENNLESMKFTKEEYVKALKTVEGIAQELEAGVSVLMSKNTGEETDVPAEGNKDVSAKVLIRPKPKSMEELLEIRVAVVGNGLCAVIGDEYLLTGCSRCRKVYHAGRVDQRSP